MIYLKDVIHYYIGCKCLNTFFPEGHEQYNRFWRLMAIRMDTPKPYCLENEEETTWTDSIMPKLRKLEFITEQECNEYNNIRVTMHSINKMQDQIKTNVFTTKYLLDRQFDLFGLIQTHQAFVH